MMTDGHLWACPHSFRGCTYPGLHPFPWNPCAADLKGWAKLTELINLMKPKMKRPDVKPVQAVERAAWVDADFEKDYPYLSAFLKDETWDDGSARTTGTLLLFVQDGLLKACINDRAGERSAFVTGPTLTILFDLIEEGLTEDKMDWRKRR